MGAVSLQNAVAFLQFLALQASLPFVIILATSGARIRAVAPFVLAGLLVFSFSNMAAGTALIAALDFGAFRDALMSLRPEEKEVFLLRQNGELTYEQIAAMRERPVGTVKTQMRSALQKLRAVLAT